MVVGQNPQYAGRRLKPQLAAAVSPLYHSNLFLISRQWYHATGASVVPITGMTYLTEGVLFSNKLQSRERQY